jgi:tetratricopeptide (TPR) repeat protein
MTGGRFALSLVLALLLAPAARAAVDFAPAPPAPKPNVNLAPGLPVPNDKPSDNSARLKQALSGQIRMPPLTMHDRAVGEITYLTRELANRPDDPALLGRRCMMRALGKIDLEAGLADCDRALAVQPQVLAWLDDRALILYQQDKFKDARYGYDHVLALDPKDAAALFMRGQARGKLGDAAGRDRDVAAARVIQNGIRTRYQSLGVIP